MIHFDWDVSEGVWNSVVAAGNVALIEDLELRGALTAWPGVVDDVLDNQHLMQSYGLQVVVPAMAAAEIPVFGRGVSQLTADELADFRRVFAQPAIRVLLATKYTFYTGSLEDIQTAQNAVDEILDRLEETLSGT